MLKIPLSQTIRVPINYYCYNTNKMPNNFEINFFVSYVRSKKSQQELCTLIKKFISTGSICNVVCMYSVAYVFSIYICIQRLLFVTKSRRFFYRYRCWFQQIGFRALHSLTPLWFGQLLSKG